MIVCALALPSRPFTLFHSLKGQRGYGRRDGARLPNLPTGQNFLGDNVLHMFQSQTLSIEYRAKLSSSPLLGLALAVCHPRSCPYPYPYALLLPLTLPLPWSALPSPDVTFTLTLSLTLALDLLPGGA